VGGFFGEGGGKEKSERGRGVEEACSIRLCQIVAVNQHLAVCGVLLGVAGAGGI
jgi:hypothetical protein